MWYDGIFYPLKTMRKAIEMTVECCKNACIAI